MKSGELQLVTDEPVESYLQAVKLNQHACENLNHSL